MGKLRTVLLVDDDDTTNFLNRFFLNQLDTSIDVLVAKNGKEAMELISTKGEDISPCLLILDTNMPVMDGWEFLECYEKRIEAVIKKNITLVMLPPNNAEEYTSKILEDANVAEVMQKPMSDIKFRLLITKYFS